MLDDELISVLDCRTGQAGPRIGEGRPAARCGRYAPRGKTSDTVVVYLHWGVELEQCPTPDQRRLAKQLVAAGADVMVGGHAHRVQGAGRMGKALVGYGLGNFVWYGTSELSTQTGVLFVTVTAAGRTATAGCRRGSSTACRAPLSGAERRQELASWRSLRGCTGLKP